MFKLDLEKAEEPEIKLPTSAGSLKKEEGSRKIYFFALITEEGFLVSPCYSLDWVNLHVKFTNNFWRI